LALAALFLALGVFGRMLWDILLLPALGTDSLIYHLAIPAIWLKQGLLSAVDLPFHDGAAEHSPMLSQIINYLLMRLTGDDGLTWLVQGAFLAAAWWAFFASARLMGLGRGAAALLTALLVLFPPFAASAQVVNNELVLTCGLALFALGLLMMRVRPGAGLLFGAGGMAVMLASKHVGIIYAAAALPLAIPEIWRLCQGQRPWTPLEQHHDIPAAGRAQPGCRDVVQNGCRGPAPADVQPRASGPGPASEQRPDVQPGCRDVVQNGCRGAAPARGGRRRLLPWAALSAALVLAGGAFYFRNWLAHGNPLFPARVSLLGRTIFPGLYDQSVLVSHGWSPAVLWRMLADGGGLFGPPLVFGVLLWLGAAALPILSLLRYGRRAPWPRLAAGTVFPVIASLLFFALVPFWGEHRLLFPVYYALWLGAAGTLALVARMKGGAGGLAVKLGLAAALLAVLWSLGLWLAGWFWLCLAAAAALAFAFRRWRRAGKYWPVLPVAACLAALLLGPVWYPAYRAAREEKRDKLCPRYYGAQGRAWQLVNRLSASPGGLTVAYSGSPLVFPLFGARLQNRVVYVPLSPEDRPSPVALQPGDSLYLRLARARREKFDESYWLAGLRDRRVDLLLLVDDPKTGGVVSEAGAVLARPEVFKLEFAQENVRVFRVRRPEAPASVRAP
jgi:hypothetical protein